MPSVLVLAILLMQGANVVETSGDAPSSGASTARERALARVAARAASSAAAAETAVTLALPAPTGAADELLLARATPAEGDVLQLSVGVRLLDDVCEFVLTRGASLPARSVHILTSTEDDQAFASIELYVGERPFCKGNRFLGAITLDPLPVPSYRSFLQIEVIVEVGIDGLVSCHCAEVENRALGEPFATGQWQGQLLAVSELPAMDDPIRRVPGGEVAMFSHALAKHLPVLLATRTVRLPGGRDVVIRQHMRRTEERVGTGGVLWESAIVLADYVSRRRDVFNWTGKRVLELGAGTGLVAISLALEGAHVCATDGNPQVVKGARANVEGAEPLIGRVSVEIFDWNSAADRERIKAAGPWDAIVGSDLVYPGNAGRLCVESNLEQPPADQTLLSLLSVLAGPETQVILALKDRTGEVTRFMDLVKEAGSEWELMRASPENIMPEFRAVPALAVLHLRHIACTPGNCQ